MTKDGEVLANTEDLRRENEQKIKRCFLDGAVWTKTDISKKTKISCALITNVLQKLQMNQEIIFVGEASSTGGRKSKQYQINPDKRHILQVNCKVDENGFQIIFQISDMLQHVLEQKKIIDSNDALKRVLEEIERFYQKDSLIDLIIVSIPGICNKGYIEVCDIEELEGADLGLILSKRFNSAVILENDVNVACIGFSYQFAQFDHLAFLYQPQSSYVGCGIMIDKKLYNGASHFAGELRYLPFYTHEEQDEMLKTNPKRLLEKQIMSVCCVLDPQIVGVFSAILKNEQLNLGLLPEGHRPKVVCVDDMDELIFKGLYQIGVREIGGE